MSILFCKKCKTDVVVTRSRWCHWCQNSIPKPRRKKPGEAVAQSVQAWSVERAGAATLVAWFENPTASS